MIHHKIGEVCILNMNLLHDPFLFWPAGRPTFPPYIQKFGKKSKWGFAKVKKIYKKSNKIALDFILFTCILFVYNKQHIISFSDKQQTVHAKGGPEKNKLYLI